MAVGLVGPLVGLALALVAEPARGLVRAERALAARAHAVAPALVRATRERIRAGEDPLGEALAALRTPAERRARGAVYTPDVIVRAMTAWCVAPAESPTARTVPHVAPAKSRITRTPTRVVDPGAGSGRFLVALGHALPHAELVAVEVDPLATLLLRANVAVHGFAARTRVVLGDFRHAKLPAHSGPTLFVGNPPYVRHHGIAAPDKLWLTETARRLGLRASALAGLHAHFFLATALHARPGDYGAFVTAAEWLDVNYGALVRALMLGPLGGTALHLVEPRARPFADADTTAVIACFSVGEQPAALRFRRVRTSASLGALAGGRAVTRERCETSARWSTLTRRAPRPPAGHVELGELFAVHRGQVTGDNGTWIAGPEAAHLPLGVHFPTITRAKELFAAAPLLSELSALRHVIDLPADLDVLELSERRRVDEFLRAARLRGVHRGFIAQHRKAWWSVGLHAPAPILATYMARRPPAFVRNPHGARHINIAHGLYPRVALAPSLLDALTHYLNTHAPLSAGRTYAGGLTKFEPREMERLFVPRPEMLERSAT